MLNRLFDQRQLTTSVTTVSVLLTALFIFGSLVISVAFAQSAPLAQPTMNPIQCGANGTSVTLSWGSVPGAGAYPIRFDRVSNNSASCLDSWHCPSSEDYINDTLTTTSITRNITPGAQYAWWVHAKYAGSWAGVSGYTKQTFSCASPMPPAAPASMTASCAAGGASATLSWPAVTGATTYQPRYSKPAIGSCPSGWILASDAATCYRNDVTTTSVTVPVTPGATYDAWVHASNAAGGSPATHIPGNAFTCTSASALPQPAMNAVQCSADGTSATLSWGTVSGSNVRYAPRYKAPTLASCPLGWYNPNVGECAVDDVNATSVTVPVTPNATYQWWVHAKYAGTWIGASGSINQSFSCTAPAPTYSSVALDWMVKDVCVDANNKPTSADPYYGCPAGTTKRKIAVGDALAYHNVDQKKFQQNDSFPILDSLGNTLYFHTFDFKPFNQYNTYDGSDGYDVYSMQNGFLSGSHTQDGGGYRSTFFGTGCTQGNGWLFFPLTNFLSGGEQWQAIAGGYWEQLSQLFPGNCPGGYSNSLNSWELRPNTQFGGIAGNPIKTTHSLVTWHGYEPDVQHFLLYGHLEVFYFTQHYGLTRWEVWTPVERNPAKTTDCLVPNTVTYKGRQFIVEHCRDWSVVTPDTAPKIPLWPVPNANKLSFWHFTDGGFDDSSTALNLWHRFGSAPSGSLINWSAQTSTSARDTQNGAIMPGVRYLAINCGAAAGGTCGPAGSQAIYQDLPASSFTNNGTYLYGVSARTAAGTGTLRVGIQVLNSVGTVLWQDTAEDSVAQVNGVSPQTGASQSVYLSSKFIGKSVKVPLGSGAAKVRFLIMPVTTHTFHLLDAWVNTFPTTR